MVNHRLNFIVTKNIYSSVETSFFLKKIYIYRFLSFLKDKLGFAILFRIKTKNR